MGWPTKYTGEVMDATLEKGRQMKTSNNGWIRMESSKSKPINLNNLKNTGNYLIEYWTNGPTGMDDKSPISIIVNDINGILYQYFTVTYVIFSRQLLEDGSATDWKQDQSNGTIYFDTTAPSNPESGKTLWFDTTTGSGILKLYIDGEWVEIRSKHIMKKSVYDPQGKNTDIYEYINNAITKGDFEGGLPDMTEYNKHMQNSSIHITAEDLEALKAMPTTDTLKERTDEIKSTIKSSVESAIGSDKSIYSEVDGDLSVLNKTYYRHVALNLTIHPSEEKITSWNNKADKDHSHNAADHTVKINSTDISGQMPESVSPYYIKERSYKIDSESSLDSITKNPYHNGDSFYIENAFQDKHQWHAAQNEGRFNGRLEVYPNNIEVDSINVYDICYGHNMFAIVGNVSNTNKMFTSGDGIVWKEYTGIGDKYIKDNMSPGSFIIYGKCNGEDCFVINTNTSNIIKIFPGAISIMTGIPANVTAGCFTGERFVFLKSDFSGIISTFDLTYWETLSTTTFSNTCNIMCYGNGMLVLIPANADSEGSMGKCYVTSDFKKWTSGDIINRSFFKVCYGNGKFIALTNMDSYSASNKYSYSVNGVTWTEATLPISDYWHDISYGDGVFVAVCSNDLDETFYYSTDGIAWKASDETSNNMGDINRVIVADNKIVTTGSSGKFGIAYLNDPFLKIEATTGVELTLDQIINKPITIAGYGITDIIDKTTAEADIANVKTEADAFIGSNTKEQIENIAYKFQCMNFANTKYDEASLMLDNIESLDALISKFASYPVPS